MKFIKENYERLYGKTPDASSYGKPTDLVTKIADVLPQGKVLDLGAGDGRQALYLAARGFEVTAIDLSEAALEKLQRLANLQKLQVTTELADLNYWSIYGEYDAIIAIAILQHLKHDSALRILNEMKVHTKRGGINAITTFTKNGDRYLVDQGEDPEAFYPEDNWLQEFYSDWHISEHSFLTTNEIRKLESTGMPMQSIVERIFAQKP
jgi:tellurite methyltransferase